MNTHHRPGTLKRKERKWFYPVIYAVFLVIHMLPLYAEKPFAHQDTQDVILSLLKVCVHPYEAFAPVFHIATVVIVGLVVVLKERMGRILAAYMGLNYLAIAFVQGKGPTEEYGFVVLTGILVGCAVLGVTWIAVAVRGGLQTSFRNAPLHRCLLLPLAILAFWAPYAPCDAGVRPDFSPLLLLTSPDYGLTLCFTTPVFLYLLVLFYPRVNAFAYRITAFTGLLYGLVNMTHFFNPGLRWMGVLHLPLLIISFYAWILPRMAKGKRDAVPTG